MICPLASLALEHIRLRMRPTTDPKRAPMLESSSSRIRTGAPMDDEEEGEVPATLSARVSSRCWLVPPGPNAAASSVCILLPIEFVDGAAVSDGAALRASMTRALSPPEATMVRGRRGSPGIQCGESGATS